eukprot:TRINITY_DN895_c0_g1_i2.p1 TRINITY_DN895_c0_g1~~TRINITY_DN895_c0_g1_i2.p1  ORF type:complete len:185 (+),score=35.83 TRINITY_DN895_c0_g1_i2:86-640(+)
MQLKIRSLTGATHDITVPEFGIVGDVKNAVKSLLGIPNEVQRLIFLGRELADESKPLGEYKVVDGSVLHLVIRANVADAARPADSGVIPRRNSAYEDLEHQSNPYAGPNYAEGYQDPVALGFMSEQVYNVFRLSRFIKILTVLDMLQILLFASLSPVWLAFLPLPIMGYYAADKLRAFLIIPVS